MLIMQPSNQLIEVARQAFQKSGWSIKRLSRESSVSYSIAHRFATGIERDVQVSTLVRILNGLGYELVIRQRKG